MEYFNKKLKKIITFFAVLFIIFLIVTIICLLMLKYAVEGENNMPFELSQMVVVSTAEGLDVEGEKTWNFNLVQSNDIYIHITKNKSYKETQIIKNITIDNFLINNEPSKGEIIVYRPSEDENKTYEYTEDYIVKESLVYRGEEATSLKELTIANQGGVIAFRYAIQDLGSYSSEDEEIKHDGTILSKAGIDYEEIKCNVSFDITIELVEGTKFTGTVTLDLPVGNVLTAGTSNYEKTDFSDVIFKRN